MTETTNHTLHVGHHYPLYVSPFQDARSFIEQAIEDMEHIMRDEEEELERREPLSLDVLSLLEQEEQESLERNIQQSKVHHWRTLPGIYKASTSRESAYDEDCADYMSEEVVDYAALSALSETQQDYTDVVQVYDGLADALGDFESLSYKLTREVLGDRFAEMTRTLMKELEY